MGGWGLAMARWCSEGPWPKSGLIWVVNDTFGGSNAIQLSIRSSRGTFHAIDAGKTRRGFTTLPRWASCHTKQRWR